MSTRTLCPISRENTGRTKAEKQEEESADNWFGCPECRADKIVAVSRSTLEEPVVAWNEDGEPTAWTEAVQPSEYIEDGYRCLECDAEFDEPADLSVLTNEERMQNQLEELRYNVNNLTWMLHAIMEELEIKIPSRRQIPAPVTAQAMTEGMRLEIVEAQLITASL